MTKGGMFSCLLAVAIAACGCTTYHSKPISASQAAASFEARRLDDPGLKAFLETNLLHEMLPWPLRKWNSTTLTLAAFYYHPDLDVARAQWRVAKAGIETAGEHPNPSIGLLPQYASNTDMGISPWLLGLALDIPIETAGKRGHRIAQAKHMSDAARLTIATTAWRVRSRLKRSLLDYYAAKRILVLLKDQAQLLGKNVRLLEARKASNLLSPFVLNKAKLRLEQTLLAMHDAQKRKVEAYALVAEAIGVPVHALEGHVLVLGGFGHPPRAFSSYKLRREALTGRPDVLAALATYAAAESALQLEIAKQYPNISIGPGYEYDQGENKWGLGLSITLPLFNQNKGPIAEANARRAEAEANFNALQATIIGEIDRAIVGYKAALTKLEAANRLLASQKIKRRMVIASAGKGEVRRMALLQAQLDYDAITQIRRSAVIEAQRSLVLLEDTVQRPLDEKAAPVTSHEENPRSGEDVQ